MESAKSFIERMKSDEEFAKKVMECKEPEARMAFVKTEGHDFTAEDIEPERSTLSDEELDSVVGARAMRDGCYIKWTPDDHCYYTR